MTSPRPAPSRRRVARILATSLVATVVVAALTLVAVRTGDAADPAPTPSPSRGSLEAQLPVAGWVLFDEGGPAQGRLAEIQDWCHDAGLERRACIYEWFSDATSSGDVTRAQAIAEDLKVADARFLAECHHAYHGIGQQAATVLGLAAALEHATPTCQAGYIHGALQSWASTATPADIDGAYRDACAPLADPTTTDPASLPGYCGHGLGHALSLAFPTDIVAVADRCAEVADLAVAQGCMEGAIMEFGGLDHVTEHIQDALGARPADSLTTVQRDTLCSLVPDRVAEICAHRVFQLWSQVWADTEAFSARCAAMETPAMEAACIRSFGDTLLWRPEPPVTVTDAPARLRDAHEPCTQLPEHQYASCTAGFAETLWRDIPLSAQPVASICAHLPADAAPACAAGEDRGRHLRRAA